MDGDRRAFGLLLACHPGPTLVVTTLATTLAVASDRSAVGCVLVAAAVLTGQLCIGWTNDALDADRDRAAGRRDKPVATGRARRAVVAAAAVTAFTCCVPLSLASGPVAGGVQLIGVVAGLCYDLGVKATPWSPLPYAVGFASLPTFVSLGLPGAPWPHWPLPIAGALLGVGAHLANVLPDIDDDLAAGVRGLPQRLGAGWTRRLAGVPMLAATVLLVVGPGLPAVPLPWVWLAAAALLVACGTALAAGRFPGAAFLTAIAVAALNVVLLVWQGTWTR
jgi:4-hydroxybenzoate polyprenyltransferase